MTDAHDLARYAAIFAADAGTDALYRDDRYTDEMAELCIAVAEEAIKRRDAAAEAGKDFYACAFVEEAAMALKYRPEATLEQILDAGQKESDNIAGRDWGDD
jgi:uncharacterized membrane protein